MRSCCAKTGCGISRLVAALGLAASLAGCSAVIPKLGTDPTGEEYGKTYYLGGAGTFGHTGTLSVPAGLRDGGYRGAIEVVGWQGWFPSTVRDQVDRSRNMREGRRLAEQIMEYLDAYPGRRVNIIALSAGTGITTWALESLPENYPVGTVVFLGSSLSRHYDLSKALERVGDKLYNFYSTEDRILKYALPITGTVDRPLDSGSVGGRFGFAPPAHLSPSERSLYLSRLKNMPPFRRYSRFGYDGGHTDGTNSRFVRHVLAPLLMGGNWPRAAPPPPPDARPSDGSSPREVSVPGEQTE